MNTTTVNPSPVATSDLEPLAVDAKAIVTRVFSVWSLRSWRRLDAEARCPRGFSVLRRKFWRVADLQRWSAWGFPDRVAFEARLKVEGTHDCRK